MSAEKLKQLKLYKKLERDLTYREKLEQKIRQISQVPSSTQFSSVSKQLNNNKKYFQEEQRNAEIQRQNRILFQKIQSQGMKSQYYNKSRSKNRSSKTLNSMQDYDEQRQQKQQRKYNNFSQNKIHYRQQEQSRASFEQNQQIMRPKSKSKKMVTEISPAMLQILKSRMIQSKVESHETILFQGIAEIDSIRFKVKISIKEKTYSLTGKNKHTQIMLKMDLGQYKKFHKQVLMGNPSSIFQYLMIDKGKIRFRTLEEEQEADYLRKKKIYKIHEEEEEEIEENYKKYKPMKRSSNQNSPHAKNKHGFLEQKYGHFSPYEDDNYVDRQVFQPVTIPARHQKRQKSVQKMSKKQNIFSNINKKPTKQFNEKYRTLQDYINDKDVYHYQNKDLRTGQSTQIEVKNMKNRYKLPYI